MKIDLNCDMGESFGAWTMGEDESLMPWISSVNIACGFHAGDASVMRKTVNLALKHQLAIGAHPGFPDLQGFGRRNMNVSESEVFDICIYQIGALKAFVEISGGKLHHVKPHGALYNMAAQNSVYSAAIAAAVHAIDPNLILYGLAGSHLISEAKALNLKTAAEVFADRTYQNDATLTPRSFTNALIETAEEAVGQVIGMIENQRVQTIDGNYIPMIPETVCIHGDGKHALRFVQLLNQSLKLKNIEISAIN